MAEPIIARRITLDEYLEHCSGKTEYLNGKIMVDGTELFVSVKEFDESTMKINAASDNASGATSSAS